MPNLQSLWIKYSSISSLSPITTLKQLEVFYLGGAPLTDLSPLTELPNLRWLELEGLNKVNNIDHIGKLTQLISLGFSASFGGKAIKLASFAPLSRLTELRFLTLDRAEDLALAPLASLHKLRWLGLPNYFPSQEFACLARALPQTHCERFAPYVSLASWGLNCQTCQTPLLQITGKGKPRLCPNCQADKVTKHVEAFK